MKYWTLYHRFSHVAISWRPPAGGWADISCENIIQFWLSVKTIWSHILASHLPFSIAVYNHDTSVSRLQGLQTVLQILANCPSGSNLQEGKCFSRWPQCLHECTFCENVKLVLCVPMWNLSNLLKHLFSTSRKSQDGDWIKPCQLMCGYEKHIFPV